MGRPRNEEAILSVWYQLEEGPATFEELMARTGLSQSAARTALRHINHTLQSANHQPIVFDRNTGQYKMAASNIEFLKWHIDRLKDMLTRAQTEIQRSEAAFGKWGKRRRKMVVKRLDIMSDDLAIMVEEIATEMSRAR